MALALSGSALAAEFYVVVPVKGRTGAPASIAVTLNSASLPNGLVGQAYDGFDLKAALQVTGDAGYTGAGVTWSIVTGALPPGLVLNSNGTISGTPTVAGTSNFTVRASYKTASGERAYQVLTYQLTITLATAALPAGNVGVTYNYDFKPLLSVTGDLAYSVSDASFSVSGTLPPGLTLSSNGVVSGSPTATTAGTNFDVVASYKTKTGQQSYTIVVNGAALQVTKVFSGDNHSCALTPSGGVKCWGYNTYGQLGDGTTSARTTPVSVVGLSSGVADLAVGSSHTCALTSAGAVKCWGNGANGRLGIGASLNQSSPADVVGLTSGVRDIAAGFAHGCAVLTSGAMKCWGYNAYGQVGDATMISRASPVDVSGITDAIAVGMGDYHTCAITAAGALKCWGYNNYGQLGDNSVSARATPVDVSGLTSGVADVAGGTGHTCARMASGAAKCWGYNAYGQVGDATTTHRNVPVGVSGLTSGVTSISSRGNVSCATVNGGSQCWGINTNNQLGDGTVNSRSTPVSVSGLTSGVTSTSNGMTFACAQLANGTVKCWGANNLNQLGDGTTSNRVAPGYVQP